MTPSPPHCGKRPPTTTSRPSCCGSTAPAVRSPVRRPSGGRSCAPGRRQAGGGVDGCGRGVRRLLRVDGGRRHRGERGHHHGFDRCGHRQAGGPGSQGPLGRRHRFGAHQRQCRRVVGRTRRSPPSSTHRWRPRPTCSTPTSCNGWPKAGISASRRSTRSPGAGCGPVPTPPTAAWSTNWAGLRTAIRRAKVLAGLDADAKVKIARYPGSSLLETLRPKPSSQPAAASLPEAVGGLLGQDGHGDGRPGAAVADRCQRAVAGGVAVLA